ncbi:AMP-dependent synthetase/ligase [Phormidium sp. CCY1219]|uniref:AMP-dependent synthetase/ligase n=1 Tax=Phormidium sp. CCY1219 TaxID=2886104 RepID=UPI002D1F0F28|nr:AMP-binding protein [Phormidium sp. CCY1219]MEB3827694.1 AMP-binding protein [Phormidium sp. CCY1219]
MNRPSLATATQPTASERENRNGQKNTEVSALPEMWALAAERFGDTVALYDPHGKPEAKLTYSQARDRMVKFAVGLQQLGVTPGDRVALFSENSHRWAIADMGIMTAGAVDVVRSSNADKDELLYILSNSESTALVVENQATLKKLREGLNDLPIAVVILLSDEEPEADNNLSVLNFNRLIETGGDRELEPVEQTPDTLAALIYTSGTTGKPKAVMLSHSNLLHQVNNLSAFAKVKSGDRVSSILPPWHIYERAIEYYILSQGCTLVYTNLRHVKRDLKAQKINYFVSVPRLLEFIHDAIEKQLGKQSPQKQRLAKFLMSASHRYIQARRIVNNLSLDRPNPSGFQRLRARGEMAFFWPLHRLAERVVYQKIRQQMSPELKLTICGGGTLAMSLDTFYETIGIEVLVGYGLTETSPVLTARSPDCNLRGSAGQPIPATEIRIVDPETKETLPQGEKGLVLARGPQIMQGYYRNPEATEKVIDAEGWFNTEDLGWLTVQDNLVLTGRAKDTIVLSNGENIEPQPLERACARSRYIDQITIIGQDRRSLGALIVPNFDALKQWAKENQVSLDLPDSTDSNTESERVFDAGKNEAVESLFRKEMEREIKNRPGYNANQRIGSFRLLLEPFSQENGMLTQTLKVKRNVVLERYKETIEQMFSG